jgi:hypothetical protein
MRAEPTSVRMCERPDRATRRDRTRQCRHAAYIPVTANDPFRVWSNRDANIPPFATDRNRRRCCDATRAGRAARAQATRDRHDARLDVARAGVHAG